MYDIKSFQSQLSSLGGLNLRGEPMLRVVKGSEVTTFAYGRIIPKYFVAGGAVKDEIRKFRLRNIYTNEVTPCTFDEAKECWDRPMRYDVTNYHIAETCYVVKVTPTARDGYFVEQYIPPEKIQDTPETWEATRWGMWYDEEQGKEVWTDKSGPFPFQGRYEFFVQGDELNEDLLLIVRRALAQRNEWKQVKSDQLMVKDVFDAAEEREVANEAEVTDMLKSEMAPHAFRGLYISGAKPNDKCSKEFFGGTAMLPTKIEESLKG